MTDSIGGQFLSDVRSVYESRGIELSHSVTKSAGLTVQASAGHPAFDDLEIGERRLTRISSVFLDLTDFTRRSFWDGIDDVTMLGHAVLSAFARVIDTFGGHVLGLRGDGLFAGFDEAPDAGASAGFALTACAVALDATQNRLNPWLVAQGKEHVQARAGVDFGQVAFVRSGTADVNEINVIGHSANFAAKCEKIANSWEIVAGQGVKYALPESPLLTPCKGSPKRYRRGNIEKTYSFHQYRWRPAVAAGHSAAAELNGRALTQIPRLR